MRSFDKLQVSPLVDVLAWSHQSPRIWIPLLQRNASKGKGPAAVIPQHVHEPLLPIVIMKEGWIKARRVDIDWI